MSDGDADAVKPLDYVVCFIGNIPPEHAMQDDEILDRNDLWPVYATKRDLNMVGHIISNIDGDYTRNNSDSIVADIESAKRSGILGNVYLYGASGGGRVILRLAERLTAKEIPLHYVGVTDPAFFPDMTSPPKSITDDKPIFSTGLITADHKRNYFHRLGNHVSLNKSLSYKWTSSMAYGEIHGEITGFRDTDLTPAVSQKSWPWTSDLDKHIICNGIALDDMKIAILWRLNQSTKKT